MDQLLPWLRLQLTPNLDWVGLISLIKRLSRFFSFQSVIFLEIRIC